MKRDEHRDPVRGVVDDAGVVVVAEITVVAVSSGSPGISGSNGCARMHGMRIHRTLRDTAIMVMRLYIITVSTIWHTRNHDSWSCCGGDGGTSLRSIVVAVVGVVVP